MSARGIERILVDFFDHYGNDFSAAHEGREWFLRHRNLETDISLTELASAISKTLTAAGYRILAPGEMGTEARPFGFFFDAGDRVTKIKGSSWTGRVVGFYSTTLTPRGYCIESENEPGSVQLYPEAAIRSLARRA
jgi:hypothetical protein